MRSHRGFSLLEVMVALGLLVLVVFSSIVVYTGLIAGTGRADVNREAVATLDTVARVWERRIRESWPTDPAPDPPVRRSGELDRLVYEVEDQGRIVNPMNVAEFLECKSVVVRVDFEDRSGKHAYSTRLLVAP